MQPKNILDRLVEATKLRLERDRRETPHFYGRPPRVLDDFAFEQALAGSGLSYICEVKQASPSKGQIVDDFDHLAIAREYEEASADALSVLTETDYFKGADRYLSEIAAYGRPPILRKDFVIDPYQIEQSYYLGANAVLLIASILDEATLKDFIAEADRFGLSALVEVHDEEELARALGAGARLIGANNRDLKTFNVDINTCIRLKNLSPQDRIFVAESGVKTRADIELLEQHDINAVLIGETLMRADDKAACLNKLKGRA